MDSASAKCTWSRLRALVSEAAARVAAECLWWVAMELQQKAVQRASSSANRWVALLISLCLTLYYVLVPDSFATVYCPCLAASFSESVSPLCIFTQFGRGSTALCHCILS